MPVSFIANVCATQCVLHVNSRPVKLTCSQNMHLLIHKCNWHMIPALTWNCLLSSCIADAECILCCTGLVSDCVAECVCGCLCRWVPDYSCFGEGKLHWYSLNVSHYLHCAPSVCALTHRLQSLCLALLPTCIPF